MKKILFLVVALAGSLSSYAQKKNPSFEEVLSLRQAGTPILSPDGTDLIYSISATDWKENRYDSELWLSKDGAAPFQLTRTPKGSSFGGSWSPDGQWITFLASRDKKTQLYAIRLDGGEAFPITLVEGNIGSYEWSPDGKQIAFTMTPKDGKEDKKRKDKFGAFAVDDEEFKTAGLYLMDFDPTRPTPADLPCYDAKDSTAQAWDCIKWPKPDSLLVSKEFTIRGFNWSPDGKYIAISHTPDPLINSFFDADIALVEVANKEFKSLISNPSADFFEKWSPDGQAFLYGSALDNRTSNYYENNKIFIYNLSDGSSRQIAEDFDEDIYGLEWEKTGIFARANWRTTTKLLRIDPKSGKTSVIEGVPEQLGGFTLSANGSKMAFSASDGKGLREVFTAKVADMKPKKLTSYTEQLEDWKVAQSEVISWKSKDGTEIQGVLHKPMDYDASKKYPLLVMIHGGPTGMDRPAPVLSYVYPMVQWVNKGALVLRVNYRGSAGYGADFRALNVRNLGVGDAWDVLSGVDHLESKGMIDTDKMGCMGWSQGGYISAFLTTHTDRFKAISVGAGISNWMTYYVNTDIHPFTRQYLKATPWEDEAIYKKTSPMTNINNAKTPTLIQHGEFDRRVPIANAYELAQGLRDVGVEAKLIVYKGFGHGITKPKERLAAVMHNWEWFNKYVFGEE
ncbi:MAG: S9 family peptidase [Cyanothece sp. SIO1E1]|nr:S9 family peptidase [Cyanothece sp. SIO1E1]